DQLQAGGVVALEEAGAVGALGAADHGNRPVDDLRQQPGHHRDVVVGDVSLGGSSLRVDDAFGMRETHGISCSRAHRGTSRARRLQYRGVACAVQDAAAPGSVNHRCRSNAMNEYQNPAGASADQSSKDRSVKGELEAGKGKLAQFADTAAAAGKARLDSGLSEVAGQADTLARALEDTANRLKSDHQDSLAAYTTHIASSVNSLADRLRSSSVDELASDARRLAHSNPALFLAGSVAIGFGLTRFLKASSTGSHGMSRTDRYGSDYGDSRGGDGRRGRGGDEIGRAS